MNFLKNIDTKTVIIIFLVIGIALGFLFYEDKIDKHKKEINDLHDKNVVLEHNNDSLRKNIVELDKVLNLIDKELIKNNKQIDLVTTSIENLKGKQDEIPTYVNGLSANGTANALSNYLDRKTKSTSTNK